MSIARRAVPGGAVLIDKTPPPRPLRNFAIVISGKTDGARLQFDQVQVAGLSPLEATAVLAAVRLGSPVPPLTSDAVTQAPPPEQPQGGEAQ